MCFKSSIFGLQDCFFILLKPFLCVISHLKILVFLPRQTLQRKLQEKTDNKMEYQHICHNNKQLQPKVNGTDGAKAYPKPKVLGTEYGAQSTEKEAQSTE